MTYREAPEWSVDGWLNAAPETRLEDFRGKVVAVLAFQMLCPGCAQLAAPQFRELHTKIRHPDLAVVGIHTVFEHHEAMGRKALEAFAHEYRLKFPIAIDKGTGNGLPETMAKYDMRGTPTVILIDRKGRLRMQHFGHMPDLELGVQIGALLSEE